MSNMRFQLPGYPRNRGFTNMPDTGPARDALNEFGDSVRGLERYKQGGASRIEGGVNAGRAAAANNIRRSGAASGSLAAMQIGADTTAGAYNDASANEAQFQRGVDGDIISGLGSLSSMEMDRSNSLFGQGLARDGLSLDRERFDFGRQQYSDEERRRREEARAAIDPNQRLRDWLEQQILRNQLSGAQQYRTNPLRGG